MHCASMPARARTSSKRRAYTPQGPTAPISKLKAYKLAVGDDARCLLGCVLGCVLDVRAQGSLAGRAP